MRAWLQAAVAGPPTCPIRRCPSDSRCSVAENPPVKLVDPTLVTRAAGLFSGSMTTNGTTLSVIPRDGLRRRLDVIIPDRTLPFAEDIARLKLELERDGFAAEAPITIDKALGTIAFTIENRVGTPHTTGVKLSLPLNSKYELRQDGKAIPLTKTGEWDYPWRAEVNIGATTKVELVRSR